MSRSKKATLGWGVLGQRLFREHGWSARNRKRDCQICQGTGNRKRLQSVEKRLSVEIVLMPRGLAPRIIYSWVNKSRTPSEPFQRFFPRHPSEKNIFDWQFNSEFSIIAHDFNRG